MYINKATKIKVTKKYNSFNFLYLYLNAKIIKMTNLKLKT